MADNQKPIRRSDVIRCEKCGEDYATTYKRCPFCDEKPGRKGIVGRRVNNTRGGGYGGGVNPLQVVLLVLSLILIIAALYIVFHAVAPLLGRGGKTIIGDQSSASASQSLPPDDGSSGGDVSEPEPVDQPEPSSTSGNTATPAGSGGVVANASTGLRVRSGPGSDNEVIASLSNGSAVNILEDAGGGWYKISFIGPGGRTVEGYVSKDYVTVDETRPATPSTPSTATTAPSTATPGTTTSVTSGSRGVISNASSGLRVRSGPGSDNEAIASLSNGSEITILEDTGSGWYKISFIASGGRTTEGYVSKDYVTVR